MKLSDVKLDSGKATGGVWAAYRDGLELKIARMPNPEYDKLMRRLGKPHMGKLRRARFNAEALVNDPELDAIQKKAAARAILLDWRPLPEDDDGQPMPYTPELGEQLLLDPDYDPLWRFIVDVAGEEEMFRAEDAEAQAENL